ncbi:hypothetical protein [Hwanghaeella sp.]|uniref:hypothetical protein n=1 Tax=Hwanghaeella sp. TaxID=2605943 RepID=UPI003CCC2DA6
MFAWLKRKGSDFVNRRRLGRIHPVDTFIRIDHHVFAVDDMDEHHFRIVDYVGDLIEGQRFEFQFLLPRKDGTQDEFPGHGKVMRIDTLGLTAAFMERQPYFRREIEKFVASHRQAEGNKDHR